MSNDMSDYRSVEVGDSDFFVPTSLADKAHVFGPDWESVGMIDRPPVASWAYITKHFPAFAHDSIKCRGANVSRHGWRIFHGIERNQLLHDGGKP